MSSAATDNAADSPRTLDDALGVLTRGSFPADPGRAARHYRRLARLLHPDAAPPGRRAEAAAAFARLTELWQRRQAGGTLTTRRRGYALGTILATGDLAVLRAATYEDDGVRRDAVLKIPRDPADNDLMEREARALTVLGSAAEPRHRAYAPRLVETFRHRAADGVERRVNVLAPLTGFHTLADILTAAPDGIDPRDAAWIWRRLLVALGWAHRAGLEHGAVLPEHILIHSGRHGLVLIDWCYATERGEHLPALVERHRHRYPPEVTGRRPTTSATDIHLASTCVEDLMGTRAPGPLRAFLRGCTLPAEARRPHDAWRLLAELDEVLERLYGPRTFRPFTMPGSGTTV